MSKHLRGFFVELNEESATLVDLFTKTLVEVPRYDSYRMLKMVGGFKDRELETSNDDQELTFEYQDGKLILLTDIAIPDLTNLDPEVVERFSGCIWVKGVGIIPNVPELTKNMELDIPYAAEIDVYSDPNNLFQVVRVSHIGHSEPNLSKLPWVRVQLRLKREREMSYVNGIVLETNVDSRNPECEEHHIFFSEKYGVSRICASLCEKYTKKPIEFGAWYRVLPEIVDAPFGEGVNTRIRSAEKLKGYHFRTTIREDKRLQLEREISFGADDIREGMIRIEGLAHVRFHPDDKQRLLKIFEELSDGHMLTDRVTLTYKPYCRQESRHISPFQITRFHNVFGIYCYKNNGNARKRGLEHGNANVNNNRRIRMEYVFVFGPEDVCNGALNVPDLGRFELHSDDETYLRSFFADHPGFKKVTGSATIEAIRRVKRYEESSARIVSFEPLIVCDSEIIYP